MNNDWAIARRRHLKQLAEKAAKDAAFEESEHPRAPDGKFGSGGGSSSPTSSSPHPFVGSFLKDHPTTAKQKQYLESVPKDKLHTALKLTEGKSDEGSKKVRKLIELELDDRANRGS